MRNCWPIIFTLLTYCSAFSQSPDADEKHKPGNSRVPACYLQTDRDAYLSGDTIWAKGYVTDNHENKPPYSLTVELVDIKEKKILSTQTFLISRGAASATITLPIDLATGTYLIRSYSREMLTLPGSMFTKLIKVYNVFEKEQEELIYKRKFTFYPEGGHFVAGDSNLIAFVFTDISGKPHNISGKIINSDGTLICPFVSSHNGMGVFSLKPQPVDSYFAIIDNDKTNTKYPLPSYVEKGISLDVQNDSNNISFTIKSYFLDSADRPAFLVLQMGKEAIYDTSWEKGYEVITGIIPVHEFPSGVARLCVFDKDTMLLAERLCFVNNREYVLPAHLAISFLNKEPRGENLFSLNLNEPVRGTFAVSVTDAGFDDPQAERQNIYSSVLLTPYLKSRVYNAGKYFDGEYKKPGVLLDLVMLTNTWDGIKWEEKDTSLSVKTEGGVLSGKVLHKNSRKPYVNGSFVMVATSEEDSTMQSFTFATDNAGRFKTRPVYLFGKNKLLFSAEGKKGSFIEVELDPSDIGPALSGFPEVIDSKITTGHRSIFENLINSRKYLENVIVKNKLKGSDEILQQRYTTGRFRTLYGEIYDFTDVKNTSGSILDYLKAGYRDIKVENDSGIYLPKAKKADGKFVNATVYLNEARVPTIEQLYTIKPNDIAIIKVVQNFEFNENGPAPAIAIYTRKGQDFSASKANYDIKYFDGFSRPLKFNDPLYTVDQQKEHGYRDNRLTLFWNPKAATSKRIDFIPIHFFNNDFTKTFNLVIEGFSEDGRLLYFEKKL